MPPACLVTVRPPRASGRAFGRWLLALLAALVLGVAARAETVQLASLEVTRGEDGVLLDFTTRFTLPRAVEDALLKGVPLHFVAEADIYRSRWYWRDARVARAVRVWRLAWQPLTRSYRVSFGALNQSFETLAEAMAAVRGAAHWKIAEPGQLEADASYYIEFSYRLDTSQLPRPMQIGLAGQADWNLSVERTLRVE
ncbi:MAG TPA: DUF4390 domain-containing protein [Burkholderiaceae bacterium]